MTNRRLTEASGRLSLASTPARIPSNNERNVIHKILLGLFVMALSGCDPDSSPSQNVSDAPVQTPASPSNLVSNPGFESGLTDWDDWGNSSIVTSDAYAGAHALRVGTGIGGRGQNIAMTSVAGKSFTLKAAGKMSVSGDIGWVGVHFMVGGQQQIADAKVEFNDTNYTLKSVTFTVPDGTEAIRVWAWKRASSGYLYTDEISLVLNECSTPEPMPPSTACSGSGSILLERWDGITLTNPDEIPVGSDPSASTSLDSAEAPINRGDNYGNRMRGYICAPVSGDYVFHVAGDDQTALYLSTDENPANKRKIAYHDAWTNPREWSRFATQKSEPIPLVAGRRYYIEALQVEQAGGDHLAIGWILPSGAQEMPIPGSRLSPPSGITPAPEPDSGYNPSPDVPPQNVSYSGPIVITQGGTYSGNWESRDSEVPAVEVKTSEPVTIINSNIRGAGYLIKSWYYDVNLTVRNSRGYGITPTAYFNYKKARRFVVVDGFRNVTIENNYMEGTAGILIAGRFVGNGTTEKLTIRYNKAKNIDGRIHGGMDIVQFVQLRSLKNVPGIEIAYNEVINEPGKSAVEDNINIYNSRGTSNSKIKVHGNFIKGAYPIDVTSSQYTGGGIITDGDGDINTCPSQVEVYDNHLVNLGNYSLGMASGNNLHYHHNRIFNTGKLPGSSNYWPFHAGGMWSKDYYGKQTTFSNLYEYNTVGVLYHGRRNDITANENATYQNNTFLPSGQPTQQQEIDEYQVFLQRLRDKGLFIGPR